MTSDWPENKDIKSIHDFSKWLADASQQTQRVYRGQADSTWRLEPSLDRDAPETDCFKDRVPKEKEYIEDFCNQARRFLGRLEVEHLKNPDNHVNRMTVMQHYGAPTRLLDWTKSGAIAAYFACIDKDDREGAIWWMNEKAVSKDVDDNWKKWGYKRRPDAKKSQINLNDKFDDPKVAEFVSMVYLEIPFSRAQAQRGLFTFGSRPGLAHDDQLEKQLKDRLESYGRVLIPAILKTKVIEYLERLGIDAISLQHTGADRVGLRMAWDRVHGR